MLVALTSLLYTLQHLRKFDKTKYNLYDYLKVLNPISVFHKKMKLQINDLHVFDGIDFVFFGKNVEFVDKLSDMVIVPRVRTERDSTKVTTITSFEFVHTMEA